MNKIAELLIENTAHMTLKGPDVYNGEFYQTFKGKKTPTLSSSRE
jgi:hypothetical protein